MKKIILHAILFAICAGNAAAANNIQIQMIKSEIGKLEKERDNKQADLQSCAKSVNGFKIAGTATLTGTAALGVVNIVQANKNSDLKKQIAGTESQISKESDRIKREDQERQKQSQEKNKPESDQKQPQGQQEPQQQEQEKNKAPQAAAEDPNTFETCNVDESLIPKPQPFAGEIEDGEIVVTAQISKVGVLNRQCQQLCGIFHSSSEIGKTVCAFEKIIIKTRPKCENACARISQGSAFEKSERVPTFENDKCVCIFIHS
jgi:hypothetical protein